MISSITFDTQREFTRQRPRDAHPAREDGVRTARERSKGNAEAGVQPVSQRAEAGRGVGQELASDFAQSTKDGATTRATSRELAGPWTSGRSHPVFTRVIAGSNPVGPNSSKHVGLDDLRLRSKTASKCPRNGHGSAEADTLGRGTESVRAAAENAVPPAISYEVCTNSMERAEL